MAVPTARPSKKDDPLLGRVMAFVFLGFPLLFLIGLLGGAVLDLGPAAAAQGGQGVPGVYRVTDYHCGSKGCFRSGDFTVSGQSAPELTGVDINSGQRLTTGQSVPALEVDGRVYPPGGGSAWTDDLWRTAIGSFGIVLWGWLVVWRPLRRRRGWLWEGLWAPLPKARRS